MAEIFAADSWFMAEASLDGLPLLLRARSGLPSEPDRLVYQNLILINWEYDGGDSGMPPSDVDQQMRDFELALERALEVPQVGVLAACLTGNHIKEWRYYASDQAAFMTALNAGLQGHPVYPLQIEMFRDPEWSALTELTPAS